MTAIYITLALSVLLNLVMVYLLIRADDRFDKSINVSRFWETEYIRQAGIIDRLLTENESLKGNPEPTKWIPIHGTTYTPQHEKAKE